MVQQRGIARVAQVAEGSHTWRRQGLRGSQALKRMEGGRAREADEGDGRAARGGGGGEDGGRAAAEAGQRRPQRAGQAHLTRDRETETETETHTDRDRDRERDRGWRPRCRSATRKRRSAW